jgi:WD40 repeat protein
LEDGSVAEPRRIGRYEILEEIGRGGFAVVYRARDTVLDRIVALKVLHPQLTIDSKFIQRFYQEARTAAGLHHPNIVTVHEVGEDQGLHYLAMALLPGRTLDEWLDRVKGPLPPGQVVSITVQIASALDLIHQRGLMHRDVKPNNIMVDEEGQATLLDFGIVRAAEGTRLTTTMTLLGTPEYMSPEQARGEEMDARSDVYALGVVVYQMCTGREPFSATSPIVVLRLHVDEPPPPPQELNPRLSPEVVRVLSKALAKDRDARYQTAGEMAQALREAVEAPVTVQPARPERRREEPAPGVRKTRRLPVAAEERLAAKDRAMPAWRRVPIWAWVAAGVLVLGLAAVGAQVLSGFSAVGTQPVTPAAEATSEEAATPALYSPKMIVPENVERMGQLARLGRGTVQGAAYSPDGRFLAVASSLGVYLHSAETLEELHFFDLEQGVEGVTFSPDGEIMAVWLSDYWIQLWNVSERVLLHALEAHEGEIYSVVFSPDGQMLASGSSDETVRLWRVEGGELLHTLEGHTFYVRSVAFSSDGGMLASASKDKTVKLWRVEDGELLHTLEGHEEYVWSVAFSPDGEMLASGSYDDTVRLWRASDGALLRILEGRHGNVESVAFSPDSRFLASASNVVQLWDAFSGELLGAWEGHSDSVLSLSFAPDGATLASASTDGTVRLWRVPDGAPLHTLADYTSEVLAVAISPDGTLVASGGYDCLVRLWRVPEGDLLRTLSGHEDWVNDVAISPDGELLASAADDHTVRLWRVSDGELLRILEGHPDIADGVAFSPDGELVASGSCGERDEDWRCIQGEVGLWHVEDGSLVHSLAGHAGSVTSVAFSRDGSLLASAACGGREEEVCVSGEVWLWRVGDWELVRILAGHTCDMNGMAFSSDGETLASAAEDDTVRLWRVSDGELLNTLEHDSGVLGVAFSPEGALLASASYDWSVQLWAVPRGELLRHLWGHVGAVMSVDLSLDGATLVSGSKDGTVRLWGLTGE